MYNIKLSELCCILFLFFHLVSELSKLNLRKLDISSNRISKIPTVYRKIETLEDIILDNNPLTLPPAHVSMGCICFSSCVIFIPRQHIFMGVYKNHPVEKQSCKSKYITCRYIRKCFKDTF